MERFGCYFSLFLMKAAELGGNNEEKVRGNFRRTKVLILDTGVAGLILSCKTLQENVFTNFLILQARNYIGGRFKQKSFAGVNLEEFITLIIREILCES